MPVMEYQYMSNSEIQKDLGLRLKQERLSLNLTQEALAKSCGVSRRTLVAAERGEGPTLDTFISILRGLHILGRMEELVPPPMPSPMQLVKMKGKVRQRASRQVEPGVMNDAPAAWEWKE